MGRVVVLVGKDQRDRERERDVLDEKLSPRWTIRTGWGLICSGENILTISDAYEMQ